MSEGKIENWSRTKKAIFDKEKFDKITKEVLQRHNFMFPLAKQIVSEIASGKRSLTAEARAALERGGTKEFMQEMVKSAVFFDKNKDEAAANLEALSVIVFINDKYNQEKQTAGKSIVAEKLKKQEFNPFQGYGDGNSSI